MAVDLSLIGERTLLLDCDVIQADGGTRVASVTGGYLALALGLGPLIASGQVPAEALRPPLAAVSVGIVEGQPILDLNYAEDSQAEVDLNVVMTVDGRFVEVQGTAEKDPFTNASLQHMLKLAEEGISHIIQMQQACINQQRDE
jgi:ribonuclease PH